MLTERLWLATAVARVGVWEWDVTSDALTWDTTMFDIYGVPSDIPMRYERWSTAVYDTCFAADGFSAVGEARKQQPDLIVLDLGLPAGDGFVVLERFRTNTHLAVIPIIVVSARDVHANKDRALKAGARAYVQKPWNDTDPSLAQPQ